MKKVKVLLLSFLFLNQSLFAQSPLVRSYENFLNEVDVHYRKAIVEATVLEMRKKLEDPGALKEMYEQQVTYENEEQKQRVLQNLSAIQNLKISQVSDHKIMVSIPGTKNIEISFSELGKGFLLLNGKRLPLADTINYSKLSKFAQSLSSSAGILEEVLSIFISSAYSAGGLIFGTITAIVLAVLGVKTSANNAKKRVTFKAIGDHLPDTQEDFEQNFTVAVETCEKDKAAVLEAQQNNKKGVKKSTTSIFIDELARITRELDDQAQDSDTGSLPIISCRTISLDEFGEGEIYETGIDREGLEPGATSIKSLTLANQPIFQRVEKTCDDIEKLQKCLEETDKILTESNIKIYEAPRGFEPAKSADYLKKTSYDNIIKDIGKSSVAR